MIWTILIIAVILYLGRFFFHLSKDNDDLANQSVDDKFSLMVNMINITAFHGQGHVIMLDKRSFNLYEDGANQIVNFHYSTGHLEITWKYKYFQKEVSYRKLFTHVRNTSSFEQGQMAKQMIAEMEVVIERHKAEVLANIH